MVWTITPLLTGVKTTEKLITKLYLVWKVLIKSQKLELNKKRSEQHRLFKEEEEEVDDDNNNNNNVVCILDCNVQQSLLNYK